MQITDTIPVTHNARGLGGMTTTAGDKIAPVLFRADALAGLTADGVRGLTDLGIGCVVDLRTDGERARAADALPEDGPIRVVALPILGGAMDEMARNLMPASGEPVALSAEQKEKIAASIPTLEELYIAILQSSAAQFATLARLVVEAADTAAPGVLFHCTAGKDRTGLAAALLLEVAGVSRADVVADYVQTETNLAGPFAQSLLGLVSAVGIPLTPRLETLATRSPAGAITAALDWVSTIHGDALGYLRSGGLSEDEAARLRAALIA